MTAEMRGFARPVAYHTWPTCTKTACAFYTLVCLTVFLGGGFIVFARALFYLGGRSGLIFYPFGMFMKRLMKAAIKKATKDQTKFEDEVDKSAKKAKDADPKTNTDYIYQEKSSEFFVLESKVKETTSKYWRYYAAELIVPEPDGKDESMWDKTVFGKRILSDKGIHELRKMVRTHLKNSSWLRS